MMGILICRGACQDELNKVFLLGGKTEVVPNWQETARSSCKETILVINLQQPCDNLIGPLLLAPVVPLVV